MIKSEIKSTLHKLIDHVELKIGNFEDEVILDLNKENLKEVNDIKKKELELENEKQHISGRFGWCIVCRKTANYYCKEKRQPICSYMCKLKNMDNVE